MTTFVQPHPNFSFPDDFVWGVATSSYQIEGAAAEDGKGSSIWDEFCRLPNVISDNTSGDTACDHYHRWQSDLDLIASLGVDAYRFSIAWPRVQADGAGSWNEKGLAFYERIVDGLLERGIKPYVTLNHWDLPAALQAKGGWANRDTVHRFVDYTSHVAKRIGDRVEAFTTHNEPWVMATLGHETGEFAPGIKNRAIAMQASHHLLLSHGLALQALRAQGCKSKLGIVLNQSFMVPATQSSADHALARLKDGRLVRWYMDPLFNKGYPADVLEFLGADAPTIQAGDLRDIATPMDYLGINYYTRTVASANDSWDKKLNGLPLTDMDWEVFPEGLTDLLLRINRDYALPPIFITENGAAFKDTIIDGRINDAQRTNFIARHIAAVSEAIKQGVDIQGYMVWSLLDNFEWASGFEKRFGIIHVDYATQQRTLKDSALWYQEFLKRSKADKSQYELLARMG